MHLATILRWAARLGSLATLAFIAAFVFGGREPGVPSVNEMVALLCFPVGVVVGLLLAWRFELIGGVISLVSLALFYGWMYALSGRVPDGPYFALLSSPAVGFLLAALLTKSRQRASSTVPH
jgi:hypothetical protein